MSDPGSSTKLALLMVDPVRGRDHGQYAAADDQAHGDDVGRFEYSSASLDALLEFAGVIDRRRPKVPAQALVWLVEWQHHGVPQQVTGQKDLEGNGLDLLAGRRSAYRHHCGGGQGSDEAETDKTRAFPFQGDRPPRSAARTTRRLSVGFGAARRPPRRTGCESPSPGSVLCSPGSTCMPAPVVAPRYRTPAAFAATPLLPPTGQTPGVRKSRGVAISARKQAEVVWEAAGVGSDAGEKNRRLHDLRHMA